MHDEFHLRKRTLPKGQWVYRMMVVTPFIRAGVLWNKLECFGDILGEHVHRFNDRYHTSDLVCLILIEEQTKIKGEITGRDLLVTFDGITDWERLWLL